MKYGNKLFVLTKNFVELVMIETRKVTGNGFHRRVLLTRLTGNKSRYCLVTFFPLVHVTSSLNVPAIKNKAVTDQVSFEENFKSLTTSVRELLMQWISSCKQITLNTIRVFQLGAIFLPILTIYPLMTLSCTWKSLWFDIFIKALEFCGPVYIKFGQWASTRRDIFPTELCNKMEKLQTRTSPHSWKYTESELGRVFGPGWRKIFVKFDNNYKPVGSGCVAQVYKAWIKIDDATLFCENENHLKGRKGFYVKNDVGHETLVPVAVKILHPGISEAFERDLAVMKLGSNWISALFPRLKWVNLNACLDEFAAIMSAQIDLRVEADNLRKFGLNFANVSQVRFPRPFSHLIHQSVLVETFEEGEPVNTFMHNSKEHNTDFDAKRRVLAKLGAQTLLKMVFIDNFVHGDLHPGNILVQEEKSLVNKKKNVNAEEEEPTDPFSAFSDLTLGDRIFRAPTIRPLTETDTKANHLRLVILDCGIVSLLRREKLCHIFRDTFRAIVSGEGEKVGDLFLETSEHECNNAQEFRRGMDRIVQTARQQSITLAKLSISSLMQQVFNLLIQHHVRLESEFSTVMLAVMILEGLGRSLDPNLDLLQEATPFLWAGT